MPPMGLRFEGAAAVGEFFATQPMDGRLDRITHTVTRANGQPTFASYADHDHEALREMMESPNSVLGLSDGGAHCGLICDVSMPTYLLTHWVNERERGPRLGLEHAISLQTSRTAAAISSAPSCHSSPIPPS